jgi:TRAP-type transport system periplasmic protein
MKKLILKIVICIFCMVMTNFIFAQQNDVNNSPIELKLSHFGPTTWGQHAEVLEPWTKKIEKLTNGRVKFTIYPNETLGKANEQYDFAVKGTTDIACSITEYTHDRFPLSSVMTLPFLGVQNAQSASVTVWRLYKKYLKDEEFNDVKVLWMCCHGPGQLHTTEKQIKTVEDLKGLRIRAGNPIIGDALKSLGAVPVVCTVTDGYNLLNEGKIDGICMTWDGAFNFKYLDKCKYHTEINLYTLPFFVVMNKAKYESLPADIKKIIDENSGEEMAALAGRVMDSEDAKAIKATLQKGETIYHLPEAEQERWRKLIMPLGDEWVKKMNAKGLPGQAVLLDTIELYSEAKAIFSNKPQAEPQTEPIELKISHFGPPNYIQQTAVLEPWAKKIEKLTNGRVKFSFYPKEALGKASEQYDLAVNGTADITLGLPDYTPGRFPLISCIKMPFMGEKGERASMVVWALYNKYLQDEFKDVKVLWMFCHGSGQLHTTKKQVKTLEDLKGLRIRMANPFLGQAIERLGAIPVICTTPEVYNLLRDDKIDGTVIPWEGALNFKLLEFCKYHTEINMYTLPFFVVMNKEKYESLPADIKKIIDENSGEEMAILAGRAFDNEDIKGRKIAQERGDFIYPLPSQELERWKQITMPLGDEWIDQMKAKNLPGQEVLAYVVDLFIQIQK